MEYIWSCLCWNNKFKVIGKFESFYLCYCRFCRKDTWSSNWANLFSNNAELKWLKWGSDIKIYTLSNTKHTKCFCSNCGSSLPYVLNWLLVVPAGSLDEESDFSIDALIFYKGRVLWYDNLKNAKKYDKLQNSNE